MVLDISARWHYPIKSGEEGGCYPPPPLHNPAARSKAVSDATPPPLAYSYIRFSTPEQAKGDSLRRQDEAATGWCKRNGVRLDTSLTLHDLGKSAFLGEHRKNPDRNALAAFLKMVEQGRIPRDSYLIVENLD